MSRQPRPQSGPPGRDGGLQTGKAIVVIAAVVLIGWAVLHHQHSTPAATAGHPTTTVPHHSTTTGTSAPTTTTTLVPASQIKVQVLNGVGSGLLATQWSTKLRNDGYDTLAPDNATAVVAQSVIYVIKPGYLGEAQALATVAGLPAAAINPTIPAPSAAPIPASERAKADLVLVIGPDLASKA